MRQWDPQSRLSLQLGRLFRFGKTQGRTYQAACAQNPALIFCPLLSCFSIHCSTWTKILHTARSTETCEIWLSSRDNDHAMVGSKAWETDGIISSNPALATPWHTKSSVFTTRSYVFRMLPIVSQSLRAPRSAPASKKSSTAFRCPPRAAPIRGVTPALEVLFKRNQRDQFFAEGQNNANLSN